MFLRGMSHVSCQGSHLRACREGRHLFMSVSSCQSLHVSGLSSCESMRSGRAQPTGPAIYIYMYMLALHKVARERERERESE